MFVHGLNSGRVAGIIKKINWKAMLDTAPLIKPASDLAPGGGTRYCTPILSSRTSSLFPRAAANLTQSAFIISSLFFLSVISSQDALCHARSASASKRGKIMANIWSGFRTVSVHKWPCIPKNTEKRQEIENQPKWKRNSPEIKFEL